jgi:hypothetical protein
MHRIIGSVVASVAFALASSCIVQDGPGPGPGGSCDSACYKVYNQCGLTLKTAGGGSLDYNGCLSTCASTGNPSGVDACVASRSCGDGTGIASCFNQTQPTGCDSACSKVYDQCGLTLKTSGGSLSKSECLSTCQSLGSSTVSSCVSGKSCSDGTGIAACFNSGPQPSSCDNSCAKVYDTCGLTLKSASGASLSKSECVSACKSKGPSSVESCMSGLQCSEGTAIAACFSTGPTPSSCSASCGKIYDQCGLTLQSATGPVSKQHCIDMCNKDDAKSQKIACVESKSCSDNKGIVDCLSPPAIDDCDSACADVYLWCELVINVSGKQLTESECVDWCKGSPTGNVWSCVKDAACDNAKLGVCFQ